MRLRNKFIAASLSLAAASACYADVTGKVTLTGKAPAAAELDMGGKPECAAIHLDPVKDDTVVVNDKGELANVVISVKVDDPSLLGGEVPKDPAVLDQKGCVYVPHVLPMMVGQKLVIKNDDPFLHNVHSLAQTNPGFNFGQPNKDPGKDAPAPKAKENIKVKCDVHPWMGAWIIVMDHPFFGTSKDDGTFAIKGLPDGEYTFTAWHEKYGTKEAKGTVTGGNATVNFTFASGTAMAEPVEGSTRLVSTLETETVAPCCGGKTEATETKSAPTTQPVITAMAR
jgi:hypothetical protein